MTNVSGPGRGRGSLLPDEARRVNEYDALLKLRLANERAAAADKKIDEGKAASAETESLLKILGGMTELLLKLVPAVALGYGLAAAFLYFFLVIHFYPSGLTVGDTLLFVFIALGYGLIAMGLGCSGSFLFSPVNAYEMALKESAPSGKPHRVASVAFFIAGVASVAALTAGLYLAFDISDLAQAHVGATIFIFMVVAGFISLAINMAAWRLGSPGKRWKDGWMTWGANTLMFGLLVTILWPLVILGAWPQGWYVFGVGAMSGMFLWIAAAVLEGKLPRVEMDGKAPNCSAAELRRKKNNRLNIAAALAIVSLVFPLFADGVWLDGKLTTAVMRMLGLRQDYVAAELKGEALANARQQQSIGAADLSLCGQPDGSVLVSPVTILWHGMGKRSYIALGSGSVTRMPLDAPPAPRLEIDASEMKTISNESLRCHDVATNIYFASKAIRPVADEMLTSLQAELSETIESRYASDPLTQQAARWRLTKVQVWGYADAMPLADVGSELLARQRAACVALDVDDALRSIGRDEDLDPQIEWAGVVARSPVKDRCPAHGETPGLAECDSPDGRANVRLLFQCVDREAKPSLKCGLYRGNPSSQVHAAMHAFRAASIDLLRADASSVSLDKARSVCVVH